MEIITGTQSSQPVYVPYVSVEEASQLFTKLYNVQVDKIKQLVGYDVKNFYIRTLPKDDDKCGAGEYVLKIYNSEQTKQVLDVGVTIMLHLKDRGIVCSAPVKMQQGEYKTMQEFYISEKSSDGKNQAGTKRGSFHVQSVTYLPGLMLTDACPESVPQQWYHTLGQYLARLDLTFMDYPHSNYLPAMTHYGDNSPWSLATVPRFTALLYVVDDMELRSTIESAIQDFQKEVVPKMAKLRKGLFYGDFNENNILVRTTSAPNQPQDQPADLEVVGLIDFGDCCCMCLVFEVAIAVAYMMYIQKKGDRLAAVADFLQGYESVLRLEREEIELLPLCIAGRCIQTILMGMYSYKQDPSNKYLLLDIKEASEVIKLLSSVPKNDIVEKWKRHADVELW